MNLKCPKCGNLVVSDEISRHNFCSNCGAVILSHCSSITNGDELTATEKADNDCKRIIREILEYGSEDVNPRPSYIDTYENATVIFEESYENKRKYLSAILDKYGNNVDIHNMRGYKINDDKSVSIKIPAHTISVNHITQTFDIGNGEFPILSLRPIAIKKAIGEILWIYQDQSSDLNLLRDKYGVTWWDAWDIGDRTIGNCYGQTVRNHKLIDNLLNNIKKDPDSRRHILSLWQEEDFKKKHGLKPCALYSQYVVRHELDGDYLDGFMMLRSSDYLTAGCINQCQYVALLMMIARHTGYKVGRFTNFIVNCQIYDRHIENAEIMLERKSVPANPKLVLNPEKTDFYDITLDDFSIVDYPRKEISLVNPQLKFDLGI